MVSISVTNFQGVSIKNKKINLSENLKSLQELKQLVGDSFKLNPKHFDLVKRGLCLKDEESLEFLNFKEGDHIYALKRPRRMEHITENVDENTMRHVVHSMRHLLSKATTRSLLESKMKSRDLLECIIEAVPAFGDDPIAIDVLSNAALLGPIFSKKKSKPEEFLDKHRAMVHACLILIEEVKGERGGVGAEKQDSKALYSLDHMSDNDDDMETDDDDADAAGGSSTSGNHPRRTLIQPFGRVSEALSRAPTNAITADFFRQAMQSITNNLSNSPLQPPTTDTQPQDATATDTATANAASTVAAAAAVVVTEDQLKQMSELGVSDRSLAITLLTQTHGNLEAAIALYYESQDFSD